SLREQTRAVEEIKKEQMAHTVAAGSLASVQQQIADDTRALKEKTKLPQVAKAVEQLSGAMDDTGLMLRKPQTDSETIASETVVIEAIAAMMQANKSSSSSSSPMDAEAIAAMMQAGKKPGGNTSGGNPDRETQRFGGPGTGNIGDPRRVRQRGGMDAASLPVEYRDVMQDYFRAADDAVKTTAGGKKP
ncbi:MAG: hypothetical protein NTY53_05510, partial [Kiritimatiellaeota bacterium]|nr:hypothetical protein [Kiritimatiellota bacterium]